MRHLDAEEHLAVAHAIRHARFGLAFRNTEERTAEGFRQVGTKDEAQGTDTRDQRIQVDVVFITEQRRNPVDDVLPAVEDQQDQDQVRNTTNHRGIQIAQPGQPAHRRQAQRHTDQAEHDGQGHRRQGELKRQPRPVEDDCPVAFQHDEVLDLENEKWCKPQSLCCLHHCTGETRRLTSSLDRRCRN
ncbi:hypothetical protein D3C75_912830 [compost metagenome]